MVAPAMSLELHERGNHAVCNGQTGQRAGESAVTGARRERTRTRGHGRICAALS